MEIAVFVFSPIAGKFADKYGSRGLSSVGLFLNASALIWFSTLNGKSSYVYDPDQSAVIWFRKGVIRVSQCEFDHGFGS